jgi:hypothetical protein
LLIVGVLAIAFAVLRVNRTGNAATIPPQKLAGIARELPALQQPAIPPRSEVPKARSMPKETVNDYPTLDANHVYIPGQEVKVEEPHGVYTGWISMDGKVFVRPVSLNNSQLVAFVRHATTTKWRKLALSYGCENRELVAGQVELAYLGKPFGAGNDLPSHDELDLVIGSHNAICSLKTAQR